MANHKKLKPPPGLVKKRKKAPGRLFKKWLPQENYYFLMGSLSILIMVVALLIAGGFKKMDYFFYDSFLKSDHTSRENSDIVYVDISEDSFQVIGRFPWPRHYFATLIDILKEWGAKAVVFDLIFKNPSNPRDDALLAKAIENAGNVYLPVYLDKQMGSSSFIASNIDMFTEHAKGIGHVNYVLDADGYSRRIPLEINMGGVPYPHLALRLARDFFSTAYTRPDSIRKDPEGNMLIRWIKPWSEQFIHYSFIEVLRSYVDANEGRRPGLHQAIFKDKIVFVGSTAYSESDIKPTPMDFAAPGVSIIANAFNTFYHKQSVEILSQDYLILLLFFIWLLTVWVFLPTQNTRYVVGIVLLFLFSTVLWFFVFLYFNLFVSPAAFVALVCLEGVFGLIYGKVLSDREKIKFFELATQDGLTGLYVIRYFNLLAEKYLEEMAEEGEVATLMMLDIDNFKSVNDNYGHQTGDIVIKTVAEIVSLHIRFKGAKNPDLAGRYGGEEYIVLLPGKDVSEAAFNIAERIRKKIAVSTIHANGVELKVTASIGIAKVDLEKGLEDAVERADKALYRAKRTGKNKVCMDLPETEEK